MIEEMFCSYSLETLTGWEARGRLTTPLQRSHQTHVFLYVDNKLLTEISLSEETGWLDILDRNTMLKPKQTELLHNETFLNFWDLWVQVLVLSWPLLPAGGVWCWRECSHCWNPCLKPGGSNHLSRPFDPRGPQSKCLWWEMEDCRPLAVSWWETCVVSDGGRRRCEKWWNPWQSRCRRDGNEQNLLECHWRQTWSPSHLDLVWQRQKKHQTVTEKYLHLDSIIMITYI